MARQMPPRALEFVRFTMYLITILVSPFVRIRGRGVARTGNNAQARLAHQFHLRSRFRREVRVHREQLLDGC